MMIRGERFEVDLGDDQEQDVVTRDHPAPFAFVGDVLERRPATTAAPSAPKLKNETGFPPHAKRSGPPRFKSGRKDVDAKLGSTSRDVPSVVGQSQQHAAAATSGPTTNSPAAARPSWEEDDKARIDLENKQRLSEMSAEEIEEERAELMRSLDPSLLQRLLQRSQLEDGSNEVDLKQLDAPPPEPKRGRLRKSVSFSADVAGGEKSTALHHSTSHDEPPAVDNNEDLLAPVAIAVPHLDSTHFPQPQQPPDLDPSSETFLADLHQKYFPSLPADPSKLEWMTTSSGPASYDPTASALKPKDLRFSFKGELIPPRTASAIPVTAGLHHHGDAPDAAGYTIPELAHLARSTFAAQRCIAFQTLGRILYRLGRSGFGDPGEAGMNTVGVENTMGELARSLWREMERERVVDGLVAESEGNGVDGGRHVSAKAYATEAVWLWRKGGGRRWKAD